MALEKKDWNEQLKEVAPKITELRNEIGITCAVQYVEQELAAYLDPSTSDVAGSPSKSLIVQGLALVVKSIGLGQTKEVLAESVDQLLGIVDQLDQAAEDLIAGAEAQAAELATELLKVQGGEGGLSAIPLSEISQEIERREKMREQVVGIQEQFENERDEMAERIRILGELLAHEVSQNAGADKSEKQQLEHKLEAMHMTISTIIEAVAQNDSEVELLRAYQSAVNLVYEGLPQGLIGKNIKFRK